MGYVPNTDPPPRWFAGRAFLEKSKAVLDGVDREKKEILDLAKMLTSEPEFINKVGVKIAKLIANLQLARKNVVRGIRVALLSSVEDESYVMDLKDKLKEELYNKLEEALLRPMSIKCGGQAQYGYPDYTFKSRNGEIFRISEQEYLDRMIEAIEERKEYLSYLLEVAKEIFYEIYIEEKEDEVFYYIYPDLYGDDLEFMCIPLINEGLADSTEEIIAKYGDDPYNIYDAFKDVFDRKQEKNAKEYHDDMFWEWEEEDRVFRYGE